MSTAERVFPRDQVWAAAVAAQRINGCYIKRSPKNLQSSLDMPSSREEMVKASEKLNNVALMRILLNGDQNELTSEDFEKGETIRSYFCGMLALAFTEQLGDFLGEAVKSSSLDEVAEPDKAMPLIASLPNVYEINNARSVERQKLDTLAFESTPLSQSERETITLTGEVVDSIFKKRFNTYAVNVMVTDNSGKHLVYFFTHEKYTVGETVTFTGTIKRFNGNTTQLDYTRLAK